MSDLSIDELLSKAEGKKRVRCENDSRVITFIERKQLQAGALLVPTYVIYWFYRQIYTYPGLFNQNKANKVTFFRTFKKRFPQYRKNRQRYYLLEPSQIIELTDTVEQNGETIIKLKEEVLQKAKEYDKAYGKRKKKTLQLPRQEGDSSDET